jgi:hypothetical protein
MMRRGWRRSSIRQNRRPFACGSTSTWYGRRRRSTPARAGALASLLRRQGLASDGRVFILDHSGTVIASSAPDGDPVVHSAVAGLAQNASPLDAPGAATEFRFDHVTAKPLSRETWLTYATVYRADGAGGHWILVTAMPEAFYLAGARAGSSRSAMVFALSLVLSPHPGSGPRVDGDRAASPDFQHHESRRVWRP